jgi:hypothetical protein
MALVYWAAVRPVELTAAVEHHAGQLARSDALRGADAVHLASALALAESDLIIAAGTSGCAPAPPAQNFESPRRTFIGAAGGSALGLSVARLPRSGCGSRRGGYLRSL